YAAEIEALHAAADASLAWRHGLGADVLEPRQRRREIGNFLDRLVARQAG
ncbi:type 1 glutamine amidotransferase, partial [Methylobacterium sp. WL122]